VTDYSLVPVRVRGDSASVDAEFTVTSASGVERLERTQEFVCERGEWRVVMRSEQVAVFTAEEEDADADSTREPVTSTGDLDCDDFDYQEDAQAAYEQDTSDPHGGWMIRSEKGTQGSRVRRVRIYRTVLLPNLQPDKARALGLSLRRYRRLALLQRRLLSQLLLGVQRGM
jgi:hypothetical protein